MPPLERQVNSLVKQSKFLLSGPVYQNRPQRNQEKLSWFYWLYRKNLKLVSKWERYEQDKQFSSLIQAMKASEKNMAVDPVLLWPSSSTLQLKKQIHCDCTSVFSWLSAFGNMDLSKNQYIRLEKCPVSFPYTIPSLGSSEAAHLVTYHP